MGGNASLLASFGIADKVEPNGIGAVPDIGGNDTFVVALVALDDLSSVIAACVSDEKLGVAVMPLLLEGIPNEKDGVN